MRQGDPPLLSVLVAGLLALVLAMAATGRLSRLTDAARALTTAPRSTPDSSAPRSGSAP